MKTFEVTSYTDKGIGVWVVAEPALFELISEEIPEMDTPFGHKMVTEMEISKGAAGTDKDSDWVLIERIT